MNGRAWARRGDRLTRTGAEKEDKTRGDEPAEGGDGADCAGQRGPSLVRGPRWRFEETDEDEKLHQGTEHAACWSGQGWNQGWAAGGPCARAPHPWSALLPWPGQFNLSSGTRQEQATIRRPGEIARLSLAQLGLVGAPHLPNQGAHVHPKKARPATVLFVVRVLWFSVGVLLAGWGQAMVQSYRG